MGHGEYSYRRPNPENGAAALPIMNEFFKGEAECSGHC